MESKTNGMEQVQDRTLNLDDVFMLDGVSYKICHKVEEKGKYSAIPTDDQKVNVQVNELINIQNNWYVVEYIHKTKKRITIRKK